MNSTERPSKIYQVLTTAFLVLGSIVVSTVAFRFSGSIDIKFGGDGGHLKIQGSPPSDVLVNPVPTQKR